MANKIARKAAETIEQLSALSHIAVTIAAAHEFSELFCMNQEKNKPAPNNKKNVKQEPQPKHPNPETDIPSPLHEYAKQISAYYASQR